MNNGSITAKDIVRQQLQKMEGYRQFPYKDTQGKLTIGFGRNLEAKGITFEEAYWLMDNDIYQCEQELFSNIPFYKDLDESRRVVLLNMCFQLGITGLMKFKKMLAFIGLGQYQNAAHEMLDSLWAKQTPTRAATLSNIMEQGHF